MIGALKTTAKPIRNEEDQPYDPGMQGTGKIQIEDAINTKTIIHDPLLSFGKIDPYKETNTIEMKIENTTNEQQTYTLDITQKEKGLVCKLAQTYTVEKQKTKRTNKRKIANTTSEKQTYTFDIPEKEKGLVWKLPQTYTVDKKETKTIPVELSVTSAQLKTGIHQGWLTLHQGEEAYQLPYL